MKYQDPLIAGEANGLVRGDDKAMPNRGTSSGFVGTSGSYGADTGANAINRMGSIGSAADSDPMDRCVPMGGGDFSSSGHTSPDPGRGMGGAADSDSMMETTPNDENQAGDRD